MTRLAVVGSLNVDRSVTVDHLPAPGETVLGGDLVVDNGGKGANQAVAAARLGATVTMVGAVGADQDGGALLAGLEREGVGTGAVAVVDRPSGAALIAIDRGGENSIVVAPGANAALTADHVAASRHELARASVVLAQLEVPEAAVAAAAEASSGTFILNPAPARPLGDWIRGVDILIPNRGELASLSGAPVDGIEDAIEAAARLEIPVVVVTLGGEGAVVVTADGSERVPAVPVQAVDTTAAGDSFCGAFAVAVGESGDPVAAARFAVRCAAWTVGRRGAQSALPRRSDVS